MTQTQMLTIHSQGMFIKVDNSLYTIYSSSLTGHLSDSIEPYFNQILESVRLL